MSGPFGAWVSGKTVRRHALDSHRRENIAEHTWGMLILAFKYLPNSRAEFLRHLTLHDVGERAVGDVPANILWEFPQVQKALASREQEHVRAVLAGPHKVPANLFKCLTLDELLCAEVLDRAEFALGCIYERRMGNTMLKEPLVRALERIAETINTIKDQELARCMHILLLDLIEEKAKTDD